MGRIAVLLSVLAAGCIGPRAFECGDLVCPKDTVCSEDHGSCVSEESLEVCRGALPLAPCRTSRGDGTCQDGLCVPLGCGDGITNGLEDCDGTDVGGRDCSMVGFYDVGPLACHSDCTFDFSACTGFCGDGMVTNGEACDGEVTLTCADLGFYREGPRSCTPLCTINASGCSGRCGDGVVDDVELCDGNLPESQCTSFGFDYGPTSCAANCSADLARCGHTRWHRDPTTFGNLGIGAFALIGGAAYVGSAVGRVVRSDGVKSDSTTLTEPGGVTAIWGPTEDLIFAAGSNVGVPSLSRFDGMAWSREIGTVAAIHSIHGTSATSAWAVGDAGAIHRLTASGWQSAITPAPTSANLTAVFALTDTDAIAVGKSGTVLRFDGAMWVAAPIAGVTSDLTGVWASSADDIFVAGSGILVHWNGVVWEQFPELAIAGTDRVLVTGSSPTNAFVVRMTAGPPSLQPLRQHVWHYNGTSWAEVEASPAEIAVGGIGITPTKELVLAGDTGLITEVLVFRLHGIARTAASQPSQLLDIKSIWGSGRDFIVAVGGVTDSFQFVPLRELAVWNGSTWTRPPFENTVFQSVWGASPTDVYAIGTGLVGAGFAPVVRHLVGTQWLPEPGVSPTADPTDVGGTSATDVYLTTRQGVYRRNPQTQSWALEAGTQTADLRAIWAVSTSSAFAVGVGGTILEYDGAGWTTRPSNTTENLFDVWGSSSNDVYAISANVMLHYDGVAWSEVPLPLTGLVSIYGSAANDIFVLTTGGSLIHFDGMRWAPANVGIDATETSPSAIFVDGEQVVIGGRGGVFTSPPNATVIQLVRTGGGIGK